MLEFKIDSEKCVKCGACVKDCPTRIIKMTDGGLPQIKQEDEVKCMKCQHCYTLCPTGAISIFGLNPEVDSVELSAEVLPSVESLDALIRGRRSTRKYKQENVDKKLIEKLLLSAYNCPTAVNNTALRFDVIDDIDKMNKIRDGIMEGLISLQESEGLPPQASYLENAAVEPWKKHKIDGVFRTAPHALIVSAPEDVPFCRMIDIAIALSYFELVANASGLGTTWCGLLKLSLELLPEYKEKLLTPGASDYYCMLFGYPDIHFARTANRDYLAKINYI